MAPFRDEYTPTFRGFDDFLGFYGGGEDYYTHISSGAYDMRWDASVGCGAAANCSAVATGLDSLYSTNAFAARGVEIVEGHDSSKPLFLYLAFQVRELHRHYATAPPSPPPPPPKLHYSYYASRVFIHRSRCPISMPTSTGNKIPPAFTRCSLGVMRSEPRLAASAPPPPLAAHSNHLYALILNSLTNTSFTIRPQQLDRV